MVKGKRARLRRLCSLIIAVAFFALCPAPPVLADDYQDSLIDYYGWDEDSMGALTWTGEDGNTYSRTAGYQREIFENCVETTSQYLGIMYGGDYGAGTAEDLLAIAEQELLAADNSEYSPLRPNDCKYTRWWRGDPQGLMGGYDKYEWCCIFVSYCAVHAGLNDGLTFPNALSGLGYRDIGTASCTRMGKFFTDRGFAFYDYLDAVPFGGGYTPVPGDILLWADLTLPDYWEGVYGHIGIVYKVEDDAVYVINGNSGGTVKNTRMTRDMWPRNTLRDAKWVHVEYPSNESRIFHYLTNTMGLNSAAACGILANIEKESGFSPYSFGDYENGVATSIGICQWHGSRMEAVISYCATHGYDPYSLDGQLEFLNQDITNRTELYNILKGVPDTPQGAYDAAFAFTMKFERPKRLELAAAERGIRARMYFYPKYESQSQGGGS